MPRSGTIFLAFCGLTCFKSLEVWRWSNSLQDPLIDAPMAGGVLSPHSVLGQHRRNRGNLRSRRSNHLESSLESSFDLEKPRADENSLPQSKEKPKKHKKRKKRGPPNEFTWKDLDLDSKPKCGNEKCFFLSKSDPENTGYVVSSATRKKGILRAWNISQSIDQFMNARETEHNKDDEVLYPQHRHHFYRNAPMERPGFPKKLAKRMGPIRMGKAQAMMIQEVDVAPYDEIIVLGCSNSRMQESWKKLTSLLLGEYKEDKDKDSDDDGKDEKPGEAEKPFSWDTNKDWTLTDDMVKAIHTFSRSISNTLHVLAVHPGLNADFQVFVDEYGAIYHFDLDRGRLPPPEEEIEICHCNLEAVSTLLSEVVEGISALSNLESKNRTAQLVEFASDGRTDSLLEHLSVCQPKSSPERPEGQKPDISTITS